MFGCSSAPVAMKNTKKYFKPVRTFAQIKPASKSNVSFASSKMTAKEIAEKNTVIELLKKENQRLRDRVAKLEKQLAIVES
jgi:septal ring factor EnvC (AmiA/AmiB activator)